MANPWSTLMLHYTFLTCNECLDLRLCVQFGVVCPQSRSSCIFPTKPMIVSANMSIKQLPNVIRRGCKCCIYKCQIPMSSSSNCNSRHSFWYISITCPLTVRKNSKDVGLGTFTNNNRKKNIHVVLNVLCKVVSMFWFWIGFRLMIVLCFACVAPIFYLICSKWNIENR